MDQNIVLYVIDYFDNFVRKTWPVSGSKIVNQAWANGSKIFDSKYLSGSKKIYFQGLCGNSGR